MTTPRPCLSMFHGVRQAMVFPIPVRLPVLDCCPPVPAMVEYAVYIKRIVAVRVGQRSYRDG
jgi:hypothetical protein